MTTVHLASRHSGGGSVSTPAGDGWRARSACRSEDPELFFPVGNAPGALLQAEDAKRVCRRCPVMDRCRAWGDAAGQVHGVYGGTSERDRSASRRSAEYERSRVAVNDGLKLAVHRGAEVITARMDGQSEADISEWSGVAAAAVRHALRVLLPQPGDRRSTMTPVERVLAHHGQALRIQVRGERTDVEIARFLKSAPHTIAAARRVLEHRDAAVERLGRPV